MHVCVCVCVEDEANKLNCQQRRTIEIEIEKDVMSLSNLVNLAIHQASNMDTHMKLINSASISKHHLDIIV